MSNWPDDTTDRMFHHDTWDHAKLISWTLENLPPHLSSGAAPGILELRTGTRHRAGQRAILR